MSTVGERIRELRKYYKLNQKDFGKQIGISYGHVSNIEKGKDNPSDSVIKLIAMEYNTSEIWLKTGQGKMIDSSEFGDHITLKDTSDTLMQELSVLLNDSTLTNRQYYVSILYSTLSLMKSCDNLSNDEQIQRLQSTDNLMSKIANYDLMLQGLSHRKYTDLDLKRVNVMQDNTFCELASSLEEYKNVFLK